MYIQTCVRMRKRKWAQVVHHTSDVASQITQFPCVICDITQFPRRMTYFEHVQLHNVSDQHLACASLSKEATDPSPRSYNKPVRWVSCAVLLPPACVPLGSSRFESRTWNGWKFYGWNLLPGILAFGMPKPVFLAPKIENDAISYCLGCLIGCLWFGTTYDHACQYKK